MRFKDLTIGQRFEFDHSGLMFPNNLAHGPWIKTSSRKYRKDSSPFSLDYIKRQQHAFNLKYPNEVGTINVKVNIV